MHKEKRTVENINKRQSKHTNTCTHRHTTELEATKCHNLRICIADYYLLDIFIFVSLILLPFHSNIRRFSKNRVAEHNLLTMQCKSVCYWRYYRMKSIEWPQQKRKQKSNVKSHTKLTNNKKKIQQKLELDIVIIKLRFMK